MTKVKFSQGERRYKSHMKINACLALKAFVLQAIKTC